MKQIQVSKWGGPEELKVVETPTPAPASGQDWLQKASKRDVAKFDGTTAASHDYIQKVLPATPEPMEAAEVMESAEPTDAADAGPLEDAGPLAEDDWMAAAD